MSGQEVFFNLPKAGFLLMLLLPIILGQILLIAYRKRQRSAYAPSHILSRLLIPRSPRYTATKMAGWILIWILTCAALMEPFGNLRYSSLPAKEAQTPSHLKVHYIPHEVIFLVDTSASMGVPDGTDGKTRLEEAKDIMEDVMRQLNGQTVSLYSFTSELTPLVPPTLDYLFVRLQMKDLHLDEGDVGGTRLASPLQDLREQAFPKPSPMNYTVILLSDGGDNQLDALQGEAQESVRNAILTAIPNPEQLHLHLFTIGIGSFKAQPVPHVTDNGKPVLSQLEPDILKELAAKEKGKFYLAQEWTSWDLAQDIKRQMGEDGLVDPQHPSAERQVASADQRDLLVDLYYQVPLGLALLFYMLNLLLPDVRRL